MRIGIKSSVNPKKIISLLRSLHWKEHHLLIKMKSFMVFAAILAVAVAQNRHLLQASQAQVGAGQDVVVVKENLHDNIGIGGYKYSYELSDGQAREETAELINEGTENVALRVTGSFSWTDAEGKTYTVNYVADENGFQPQGEHLPSV